MTQIIHCRVENILGVEDVQFSPNGQSVTIGGANGQGKTSAIWALVMALGGKSQLPPEPVRRGAESGLVEVALDKFNVTMEVMPDRTTRLKVETTEGARFSSPQAMLDKLFGNLAFDPGEFKSMPREKRLATLQQLVNFDDAEFESTKKTFYIARTEIGRQIKELEGKLAGTAIKPGVPAEEVPAKEVLAKLKAAEEFNKNWQSMRVKRTEAEVKIAEHTAQIKNNTLKIEELKRQITILELERDSLVATEKHLVLKLSEKPEIDCQQFHEELSNLEQTNRLVRENNEIKKNRQTLEAKRDAYEACTRELKEIDEARVEALRNLPFPIEGLGLTSTDVTFNSIPFEQISESEQWEVATAIGFSLNQKSVVFMSNCGGLDSKARQRVRERAAKLGVQLFLEVVDDQQDVQILIDEGKVAENRLQVEEPVHDTM